MFKIGVEQWKTQFDKALAEGSVMGIIEALQSQATAHAGTAKAQVKRTAIKTIERHYRREPDTLFRAALDLCQSSNPTAEEVGVHLFASCYEVDPSAVEDGLRNLADSTNWEVREWVAGACGTILERHFETFYSTMESWVTDDSENVRRAVILASMYAGKSRKPEFADPILNLVELLLPDRSKYVRDNLGPFAIGSALILYYPDQVLERLGLWVQSDDEQVRWNVAMVFSAANGAMHAVQARDIIEILEIDGRPYVKRAVNKAMKNIRKRCPEYFQS